MRASFSLAGYKTPPSAMARLLYATAYELRHEDDVLMSPEEPGQSGSIQPLIKPAVTLDGVLYIQFRY